MFKKLYNKAKEIYKNTKDKINESLVPPIRKFKDNNPWTWKFIILAAIAIPCGVMALLAFNWMWWYLIK